MFNWMRGWFHPKNLVDDHLDYEQGSPIRHCTTNRKAYDAALKKLVPLLIWPDKKMIWLVPRDRREDHPMIFRNGYTVLLDGEGPVRSAAAPDGWPVLGFFNLSRRQKTITV